MLVVWLWLAMALVGTAWTIRLLRRAQLRDRAEKSRPRNHPVRVYTRTRVRNKWLWIPAFAGGLLLGVLVFVRDWLPVEVPTGISVLEILLLMATAMLQQLMEDLDDQRNEARRRPKREAP